MGAGTARKDVLRRSCGRKAAKQRHELLRWRCARWRMHVAIVGAASKNRERASFVLFKRCEHWKSEGREIPSGVTGSIRPVREKKT